VKHCLIFPVEQNNVIPDLIHEKRFLECCLKYKPVYTGFVSIFRDQKDFCPREISFVMDKGGFSVKLRTSI
jgi:hypothetical protein